MTHGAVQCTAAILTLNNASTLPATLAAVRDFAEILILDGGSLDGTVAIAEAVGARVVLQRDEYREASGRIVDFSAAKNDLLSHASCEWVYVIDSDEYPDADLVDSLRLLLTAGSSAVGTMRVNFQYVYRGRVIERAITYPFTGVRVMRREARFTGSVHELPTCAGSEVMLDGSHLKIVPPLVDTWRKRMHYLGIERSRRCSSWDEWCRDILPARWRTFRWLSWRLTKTRRADPLGRSSLPLSHEISRILNEPLAALARAPRLRLSRDQKS